MINININMESEFWLCDWVIGLDLDGLGLWDRAIGRLSFLFFLLFTVVAVVATTFTGNKGYIIFQN